MVGLYKITSPNNKIYIGQSWDIERRWKDHHSLSRNRQPKLFNSFKKYGIESHVFSILHELPIDITQQQLNLYEYIYISQYAECGFELLNLTGGGGAFGKHSEESIKKLSISRKGIMPWNHGKHISDETKQKIRFTLTGKKKTKECCDKISKSKIGNKNMLGKKHSEETKLKISETKKVSHDKRLNV